MKSDLERVALHVINGGGTRATLIYAHRGYCAKYPENTMFAFQKAEKAGADGIELDVQLSKDGEVVVIHDEKVNRTTNGEGYVRELSERSYRDLMQVTR